MSNVTQFSSLQGQCMDVKSDVSQTSEASSLLRRMSYNLHQLRGQYLLLLFVLHSI